MLTWSSLGDLESNISGGSCGHNRSYACNLLTLHIKKAFVTIYLLLVSVVHNLSRRTLLRSHDQRQLLCEAFGMLFFTIFCISVFKINLENISFANAF